MKEGLYLPRTVFLKAFTRLDTQKPPETYTHVERLCHSPYVCRFTMSDRPHGLPRRPPPCPEGQVGVRTFRKVPISSCCRVILQVLSPDNKMDKLLNALTLAATQSTKPTQQHRLLTRLTNDLTFKDTQLFSRSTICTTLTIRRIKDRITMTLRWRHIGTCSFTG